MPGEELTTALIRLRRAAHQGRDLTAASAAALAPLLGLDSLTLSMLTARGEPELVWTDPEDALGPALEDLQYTLGEGPTVEAARTGRTVTAPDLTSTPVRWPVLGPAAQATPARAAVAVPLRLGAVTVGVLTGYRTIPAPFAPDHLYGMHALAHIALDLLLHTPVATLTAAGPSLPDSSLDLHRAEVHQATGMLTVQLGLSLDRALLYLRVYAFTHDRPLREVAHEIVTGRLRLDPP
ncbi:GAF and ANTAR domain-containing protein [Streptomyces sp. ODS28]|uniref:GAF and ANTAR domain-containing protein n=1 Tax=Streptomyces sp. ODS28 TaxID=3136688 RepID=UPI0031E9DC8C